MPLINAGTASVNQGSQDVTFVGSDLATKGANGTSIIRFSSQTGWYRLAETPADNTACKLLWPYSGANLSGAAYEIITDFYPLEVPILDPSMTGSFYAINEAHRIITNKLVLLGASSDDQIIPRQWFGAPIQDQEWGRIKLMSAANIKGVRIATNKNPPMGGNLGLDIAIDGAYQNSGFALGDSQLWGEATWDYAADVGAVISYKWTSVPPIPGTDYVVDLIIDPILGLNLGYDFIRYEPGELAEGMEIGQGFKNPKDCSTFGIYYDFQKQPALGGNVILELKKNHASLGTPVLITIPATSLYGFIAFPQTSFLSTDYQHFTINQVGSAHPGSGLTLTAVSIKEAP